MFIVKVMFGEVVEYVCGLGYVDVVVCLVNVLLCGVCGAYLCEWFVVGEVVVDIVYVFGFIVLLSVFVCVCEVDLVVSIVDVVCKLVLLFV